MAAFISLVGFTQQGVRDFKATAGRAAKFKSMAQKAGVTVKEIYWTMGAYDVVIIMEAPDEKTATAVMLSLASLGNVRTQTLRAFNSSEVEEIISKAPNAD
jgi:uncharacterized protein with GYD domain